MEEKYCILITNLVGHLTWPVTVLLLSLMFRLQLRNLMDKLRKIDWGKKTAEFEEVESDETKSKEVEKALNTNDVDKFHSMIKQQELRLLLAISGRRKSLPLTIYKGPQMEAAKRNIIELGLAEFQNGRFELTELGLKVVQKQIEDRVKQVKA